LKALLFIPLRKKTFQGKFRENIRSKKIFIEKNKKRKFLNDYKSRPKAKIDLIENFLEQPFLIKRKPLEVKKK
jgi:hypothetical protein